MLYIILFSLGWIVYASVDGFVQAYYFDLYPFEKGHRNLHPFFVIQRIITLAGMGYVVAMYDGTWNAIIFSVAQIFLFSFFHNGFYYQTRNNLNPKVYTKRFFDTSNSSQAVFELGLGFRTAMAVIGILFLIGLILQLQ